MPPSRSPHWCNWRHWPHWPHWRLLHRTSAAVLATFALAHISNHLVALQGVDAHMQVMQALRLVYRQPLVEALLLACVALQVVSGLVQVLGGWRTRRGAVAWLQAFSGLYLVLFLGVHVSAMLLGRAVHGLDTNFYFGAAGFHVPPFQWAFAPYYTLAVVALFTHLGCALFWWSGGRREGSALLTVMVLLGAVIAVLITLTLAGVLVPFEVPTEYKATYGGA